MELTPKAYVPASHPVGFLVLLLPGQQGPLNPMFWGCH